LDDDELDLDDDELDLDDDELDLDDDELDGGEFPVLRTQRINFALPLLLQWCHPPELKPIPHAWEVLLE
jgi:hypothetical protein